MLIDFFQVEAREAEAKKKRKVEASKAAAEEQKPSVSEAAAAPTTATSAAASYAAAAAAVAAPPPLAQIPAQFTEPPPPLPPVSDTMVNIENGTIIKIILYLLCNYLNASAFSNIAKCATTTTLSTIRSRGLAPCCRT